MPVLFRICCNICGKDNISRLQVDKSWLTIVELFRYAVLNNGFRAKLIDICFACSGVFGAGSSCHCNCFPSAAMWTSDCYGCYSMRFVNAIE